MRLALTWSTPWEQKEAPGERRLAILPGPAASLPEAIVTYGPMLLRPDELKTWINQALQSDLPPGTRLRRTGQRDMDSRDGWPMHIVEAELVGAQDALIECRVCVFYFFMEYVAMATARFADRAGLAARGSALLEILAGGRPDWRGSEPVGLAEVWDLETRSERPRPRIVRPPAPPVRDEKALAEALAELDARTGLPPGELHLQRGRLLLEHERPAEALAAFRAALELDPAAALLHYLAGTALGDLGRHPEAIAEWRAALALDANYIDAHYNLGQAHYNLGNYAAALAAFEAALALEPSDLASQRKRIQCLYALGRFDEGLDARRDFSARVTSGADPRARLLTEYVYDQFAGDGFVIHAIEPLRATGDVQILLIFRAVDAQERPLPARVIVETSEMAKKAGTPFVVGVQTRDGYRVVATLRQMPTYPELKIRVLELSAEALKKSS